MKYNLIIDLIEYAQMLGLETLGDLQKFKQERGIIKNEHLKAHLWYEAIGRYQV